MNTLAKEAIEAFEGRALWRRGRAVELELLHLGKRMETQTYTGGHAVVGEFALHLTGAWRVTCSGRVLVGYRDYWIPGVGVSDDGFNPEIRGASRRDQFMETFVAHGEEAHVVERATITDVGDLHLVFHDGCELETLSDIGFVPSSDEETDECWRLFKPAEELPHLVVGPGGVFD